MSHAAPSMRIYFAIFAALLVFTGVTVAAAYVDLGPANAVVAMTIAVVKALLVALYFMHLRYGSRLNALFAGAGFLWLAILLVLTLSDYWTRG